MSEPGKVEVDNFADESQKGFKGSRGKWVDPIGELLLSRAYGIDLVPDYELEYDDTATSYLMVQWLHTFEKARCRWISR